MPVCPNCKEEHRQRKRGRCPGCREWVELVEGEWVMTAPAVQILEHLEKRISMRESAKHNRKIVYKIPHRGSDYKVQLLHAKRMLQQADGDIKVVCTAIDILFERFIGRFATSLLMLQRDFPLALVLARARCDAEREKIRRERETLSALQDRAHLFSE